MFASSPFYKEFTGSPVEPPFGVPPANVQLHRGVLKTQLGHFYSGAQRMVFPRLCEPHPPQDLGGLEIVYGDVRTLLKDSANYHDAMFQVASNFNTFESTYRGMSEHHHHIGNYPEDHTQGPAVQVATLPQLLSRFHFTPPDQRASLDMLARLADRGVRTLPSGWADVSQASMGSHLAVGDVGSWFVTKTDVVFDEGLVFIPPPRNSVSLMLCAAYDCNYEAPRAADWATQFLRAAYANLFGTAIECGAPKIVLTLLGGGIFNNPRSAIVSAIEWAALRTEWPDPAGGPKLVLNLFNRAQHFPALDGLDAFFRGL